MTFVMKYDKRNRENLDKLAPNTRAAAYKWYEECIRLGADILIYETIRTVEQQRRNVAKGASQTMRSYHIQGQALDFVPIVDGKDIWSLKAYLAEPYKAAIAYAKKLGFTWGADWDSDGSTADESFVDSPHLQFEYHGYGTDKVLDAPSPVEPTPTPGIIGTVRVTAVNLNIRKGPGTSYDSIGKAPKGKAYNVTGNINDWHRIILADGDNREAWVFGNKGQYLELVR